MRFFAQSTLMILAVLTARCVTAEQPAQDYREVVGSQKPLVQSITDQTTIVFLIDGLGFEILQAALSRNNLPNTSSYFLSGSDKKPGRGRSVFPSLTFPNMSSLLTTSSVDQHKIYGNRIFDNPPVEKTDADIESLNFESPSDTKKLNEIIRAKSVFTRLAEKGLTSVSLAHFVYGGATVNIPPDIDAGLAYIQDDYEYIDLKTLRSLNKLITENNTEKWPNFIFVHLIGLDSTAHKYGPSSRQVADYIKILDLQLGDSFKVLVAGEKKRKIVSLLTADHGFDKETTQFVDAESFIKIGKKTNAVLNEGRTLTIKFDENISKLSREVILTRLAHNSGIAFTAELSDGKVFLRSRSGNATITYKEEKCAASDYKISFQSSSVKADFYCPTAFENQNRYFLFPYLVPNIASYFKTANPPDAVVAAASTVAFNRLYKGQHGGPTESEVMIPVLTRNAQLRNDAEVVRIEDLLKFLVN